MKKVLLVGAGPMAVEYAKVLRDISMPFEVVGRGAASADSFAAATGTSPSVGGLAKWLSGNNAGKFSEAVVAVGERQLGDAARQLISARVGRILVEKPGAFDGKEIRSLNELARTSGVECFVGYNRRHYASVSRAQEIIEGDGGVSSFQFEFTEWSHRIKDLKKEPGVLSQWFLHNSTHVIDMAFFLGGWPASMRSYKRGDLSWHPAGSVFTGAGVAASGALFAYCANWEAPGRFALEVLTKRHRLIFRPLEGLKVVQIGSVKEEEVTLEDQLDRAFKPGLWRQTKVFLEGRSTAALCPIAEQVRNLTVYEAILNGTSFDGAA